MEEKPKGKKTKKGPLKTEEKKLREEMEKFEEEKRAFLDEKKLFEESKRKTGDELKAVGADLLRKKEQISKLEEKLRKKDSEQTEKQKQIKKATDLLLTQRQSLSNKEKKMDNLKDELHVKATELKEKEEKLAGFKDKTAELDARAIRISELEEKVKERELHIVSMEDQIADCPRCSARDRFVSIERMIHELKEFGIHDEESENDLKEIRRKLDNEETESAIEQGDRVIKRLKEFKNEVLIKGIKYLLLGAESSLRHAKEVSGHGENVEDAERWLSEARMLIEKEEFKTAEHYIKEADFLMQSISKGVSATPQASEESPAGVARNYNCPSCYTTFTVDTFERPVRITCPGCQIELLIREDVSFA